MEETIINLSGDIELGFPYSFKNIHPCNESNFPETLLFQIFEISWDLGDTFQKLGLY